MSTRIGTLLVLTTLAVTTGVGPAQPRPAGVTGTWRSEARVHYLVESTEAHRQGGRVEHETLDILERTATLEWELTELPHGLVKGMNHWVAFGEDGKKAFDGSEPLLGAVDGDRVILSEPFDEASSTAGLVFELQRDGDDKLRGIGYSASPPKMAAMRVVMVRDR